MQTPNFIVFVVSFKSQSFMTHHVSCIVNSKLDHFSFPKHIELNDNYNNSSLTFEIT